MGGNRIRIYVEISAGSTKIIRLLSMLSTFILVKKGRPNLEDCCPRVQGTNQCPDLWTLRTVFGFLLAEVQPVATGFEPASVMFSNY